MKSLRNLIAVVTLVLAANILAVAGEITTGITSPPPPSQMSTTNGDISTVATSQTETSNDADDIHTTAPASESVIEVALSLVRGVLSLF